MLADYSMYEYTANTYLFIIYIYIIRDSPKKEYVKKKHILQCLNILPDSRHSGANLLAKSDCSVFVIGALMIVLAEKKIKPYR